MSTKNLLSFLRSSSKLLFSPSEDDPKLIYRLIATKEWKEVSNALKQTEESDAELYDPSLHFACRFHPPLDIVKILDEKFPRSIAVVDFVGKSPVHFAAEFGAPCSVIKYLAERDPFAAGAQDTTGMTPMHYLCKYYAARHQPKRDDGRRTKECMLDAMKAIVRVAPQSLNLEDMEGMNAIEYAIESDVDIKVVRLLQKACEKQWKKKDCQSTTKRHSPIVLISLEKTENRGEEIFKKDSPASIERRTVLPSLKNTGSSRAIAA